MRRISLGVEYEVVDGGEKKVKSGKQKKNSAKPALNTVAIHHLGRHHRGLYLPARTEAKGLFPMEPA